MCFTLKYTFILSTLYCHIPYTSSRLFPIDQSYYAINQFCDPWNSYKGAPALPARVTTSFDQKRINTLLYNFWYRNLSFHLGGMRLSCDSVYIILNMIIVSYLCQAYNVDFEVKIQWLYLSVIWMLWLYRLSICCNRYLVEKLSGAIHSIDRIWEVTDWVILSFPFYFTMDNNTHLVICQDRWINRIC